MSEKFYNGKIVSLSKRRGFVFQSSEIYGGQTELGLWSPALN